MPSLYFFNIHLYIIKSNLFIFVYLLLLLFIIKLIFQNKLSYTHQFSITIFGYIMLILVQQKFLYNFAEIIFPKDIFPFMYKNTVDLSSYNFLINITGIFSDKLTLVFSITTLIIGVFANMYSLTYLSTDKNYKNFQNFLNLFILSMLFLTYSNNIFIILLCWEILGVSSFFLINHYTEKVYSMKSAFKAFSYNRGSDILFFLFCMLYIYNFGTVFVDDKLFNNLNFSYTLMGAALMITSFIKSAQNVFFLWLPDSMEAPIPASALIHSATLVAAGIYLHLRFFNLVISNIYITYSLIFSGIITATVFSGVSFLQTDIKKLLAYSTIANCGFMYFLIGIGCFEETITYFILHGLLKSMLFMIFGNIILLHKHNQDFQKWVLNSKNMHFIKISYIGFFLLGSLNFTLTYEIKHTLIFGNLFNNIFLINLLNFLVLLYTINSMLYSTKVFFSLVKTQNHNWFNSKWEYKEFIFLEYSFILNLIIIFFLTFNAIKTNFYNIVFYSNIIFSCKIIIFSLIINWLDNKNFNSYLCISTLFFYLLY